MQCKSSELGVICSLDEELDTAPCGFLSFTDDGRITAVNVTLLQLLRYERYELQAQRLESILPVASRIFYQTHFFPSLKLHGKVEEVYISIKTKEGNALPVLVNAVRRERSGILVNDCIFVVMRQRLRYEEELLQARKEAEAATRAQNQANLALQQAQTALELKQAELVELNEKLESQVQQRTIQLQQALNFESLLRRVTDKVRDSLDEAQILQIAVQELGIGLALQSCNAEIYDAGSAERTVRYQYNPAFTATQAQVLKTTDSPVSVSGLAQREVLQFCSSSSAGLLHHSEQVSTLICSIYDDQGILGNLWLFRPTGEIFNDLEMRLVQQVATHCAIALRQSRLYQAAQLQVQELERLNQLKDDFLSTISHELRTPMTGLSLALQMLEIHLRPLGVFDQAENPIARYIKVLQTESQQEINLINNLLELTQINSSDDVFNPSSIYLQFWLPHVTEPFIERASQHEQQIEVWVQEDLPPIMTDLAYLERVVTELLQNACKYTPIGERICISACSIVDSNSGTVSHLQITVSNSGVEIPAIEHDRIFDKFYRIPSHDPWKYGGTGLGLALVKKLLEQLGGSIWVESRLDLTQFILQFPLTAQEM